MFSALYGTDDSTNSGTPSRKRQGSSDGTRTYKLSTYPEESTLTEMYKYVFSTAPPTSLTTSNQILRPDDGVIKVLTKTEDDHLFHGWDVASPDGDGGDEDGSEACRDDEDKEVIQQEKKKTLQTEASESASKQERKSIKQQILEERKITAKQILRDRSSTRSSIEIKQQRIQERLVAIEKKKKQDLEDQARWKEEEVKQRKEEEERKRALAKEEAKQKLEEEVKQKQKEEEKRKRNEEIRLRHEESEDEAPATLQESSTKPSADTSKCELVGEGHGRRVSIGSLHEDVAFGVSVYYDSDSDSDESGLLGEEEGRKRRPLHRDDSKKKMDWKDKLKSNTGKILHATTDIGANVLTTAIDGIGGTLGAVGVDLRDELRVVTDIIPGVHKGRKNKNKKRRKRRVERSPQEVEKETMIGLHLAPKVFELWDDDKNGKLDRAELEKHVLQYVEESDDVAMDSLAMAAVMDRLDEVDRDHNTVLDKDEFVMFLGFLAKKCDIRMDQLVYHIIEQIENSRNKIRIRIDEKKTLKIRIMEKLRRGSKRNVQNDEKDELLVGFRERPPRTKEKAKKK